MKNKVQTFLFALTLMLSYSNVSASHFNTNDFTHKEFEKEFAVFLTANINNSVIEGYEKITKESVSLHFKIDKNNTIYDLKVNTLIIEINKEIIRVVKRFPKVNLLKHKLSQNKNFLFFIFFNRKHLQDKVIVKKYVVVVECSASELVTIPRPISYREVEIKPLFVAAIKQKTHKDFSNILSKKIKNRIDFNKVDPANDGKRKRLTYQFVIDKRGDVKNIKIHCRTKELENEVVKVITNLPSFIPGKQDGKTVKVRFTGNIIYNTKINLATNNKTIKPIQKKQKINKRIPIYHRYSHSGIAYSYNPKHHKIDGVRTINHDIDLKTKIKIYKPPDNIEDYQRAFIVTEMKHLVKDYVKLYIKKHKIYPLYPLIIEKE